MTNPRDSSPPPRPKSEEDIGFERQPMVAWLAPGSLVKAGLEVFVSGVFSRFFDKRELQGGLPGYGEDLIGDAPPAPPYTEGDYRDEDGALWFDYAADVGEGFDATYTVAWLLGRETLELGRDGEAHPTRRGRLLVLGGDQVYPGASWQGYSARFTGPFKAALPHLPRYEVPHLYAIPGNHDWYDGLTSFMRLFTQGGWIGAWRTRQRRSYFALRLSEKWWLWGVDTQFDTYIDGPQLEYFLKASGDLEQGHRVILATAKPSWVAARPRSDPKVNEEGSWATVSFLEEKVIGGSEGEVAVTVSGDRHHYAHYARESGEGPEHRITAGGGGAHTMGTHGLPHSLNLPSIDPDKEPARYTLGATSPTPAESEEMRDRGVIKAVMGERGLGVLIGAVYALVALAVADGVKDQATGVVNPPDGFSLPGVLFDAATQWSIGLLAALFAGFWTFAAVKNPRVRLRVAARHWLEHALLALVAPFTLILLLDETEIAEKGLAVGWIAAVVAFLIGFWIGRLAFASYLLRVNRSGARRHGGPIFGALASTDYKNFLRMKIDSEERLTIYPVGVPRSVAWRFEPDGGTDAPWFVPADEEPDPRLIEPPIVVD